jgi:plastocyanin
METDNKHTNWPAFFLIIAFVVVVAVLVGFLYFNKQKEESNSSKKTTQSVVAAAVSITRDGFVPATIQIKKGNQVTWTNNDTNPHQVITDPHPSHTNLKNLDGDPLAAGESFTFTFEKTGTYGYHDEMNPLNTKGTVIVK